MAKKRDKDLFKRMRSLGVRKSRAREVAEAVRNSPKAAPKAARKAAGDLSGAVVEIQDRMNHGPQKRREAAKKAARTRKRNAESRSKAAKKAARTRARPNQPSAAAGMPPPGRLCPVQVAAWAGAHLRASSSPNTTGPVADGFRPTVGLQRRSRSWFIGSGGG